MTEVTLSLHFDRYFHGDTIQSLDLVDMGPDDMIDITKITGLESAPRQVSTADLAAAPGAAVTGEHIKARAIHIEGGFKDSNGTMVDIGKLADAFNPTGKMRLKTRLHWPKSGIEDVKYIDCYVEGWALKDRKHMDVDVAFTLDLICPDPYFRGTPLPPEPVLQSSTRDRLRAMKATAGGDVPCPWRVIIKASGDVVRPSATDPATGARLEVAATLHDGAVLRLSTDPSERTVRIDGDYTGRPYLVPGSEAFLAMPGSSVEISARSGEENITSDITYQSRYSSFLQGGASHGHYCP